MKIAPGVCGCGVPDVDSDGDGLLDCEDGCPNDPTKVAPGACGCGVPDTDTDGDGVADCDDGCPDDPSKVTPGDCGCGVADLDTDGDGLADCADECPDDPAKVAPGDCGCGVADTDSDGDGVADCVDGCPNDPSKSVPGACGCGVADADSDGDGVLDCDDGCPNDPNKTEPGACGCGVADQDSDGDGVLDCDDGCPNDPWKTAPGVCGCGVPDEDSDGDGVLDCNDACPDDPNKVLPGACGCGEPDTDTDGDGVPDCLDGCPNDPAKSEPGDCGCGVSDQDSDGDGVADCEDGCPNDPAKTVPGQCGCGEPETPGCTGEVSGWTEFVPVTGSADPADDSRIIYVSSSAGEDIPGYHFYTADQVGGDPFNPTGPVFTYKTIHHALSFMRDGKPDWLLLKRGDEWFPQSSIWLHKSGAGPNAKQIFGAYGQGAHRPRIRGPLNQATFWSNHWSSEVGVRYLAVVGIELTPNDRVGESATGVHWISGGDDVLFEDCLIHRYKDNLIFNPINLDRPLLNLSLRRCVILDSYAIGSHSQGLYAHNVDGLQVIECIFDHNGWNEAVEGAHPTIFNHNIYLSTGCRNVELRDSIVLRASSHGVQMRPGGVQRRNVFALNALASLTGGGDPDPATHTNGVTGVVEYNLILYGRDIGALARGNGITLTNIGESGAIVSRNIVAENRTMPGMPAILLSGSGYGSGVGIRNVHLSENVVINWGEGLHIGASGTTSVVQGNSIENNVFAGGSSGQAAWLIRDDENDDNLYSGNRIFHPNASGQHFRILAQSMNFASWVQASGDSEAEFESQLYPMAGFSLDAYAGSVGVAGGEAGLIDALRGQSRMTWNDLLGSTPILNYFRSRVGLPLLGGEE